MKKDTKHKVWIIHPHIKQKKLKTALEDLNILKKLADEEVFEELLKKPGYNIIPETIEKDIQPLLKQKIKNIEVTPEYVFEGFFATGRADGISIYTTDGFRYLYGYNDEDYRIANSWHNMCLCVPYYEAHHLIYRTRKGLLQHGFIKKWEPINLKTDT